MLLHYICLCSVYCMYGVENDNKEGTAGALVTKCTHFYFSSGEEKEYTTIYAIKWIHKYFFDSFYNDASCVM